MRIGLQVILSNKTLNHIIARHPEVKPYIDKIYETIKNPDVIIKGLRGEFKALKWYPELRVGSKYLVVVFRKTDEKKVILTAYFTASATKVKGEIVWRKRY